LEPASKHPVDETGFKKQVGGVDVAEALEFLEQAWLSYSSLNANCFSIVLMNGGVRYRHFCVDELGDRYTLLRSVRETEPFVIMLFAIVMSKVSVS